MRDYFFERIRPLMEGALKEGDHGNWPLVTLNLDLSQMNPPIMRQVWKLLKQYEPWICSAERSSDKQMVMPLRIRPLLVLTGEADSQERDFYESCPWAAACLCLEQSTRRKKTRCHRSRLWSRSPRITTGAGRTIPGLLWNVGDRERQDPGRPQDEVRLRQLVSRAHELGLWIRFYTLNGLRDRDLRRKWLGQGI